MPNVLDQLVQHRDYLDDAAPPLTLGEVTDRASLGVQQAPIRNRAHAFVQRPWWASGWAVAAATAVAVLLLGGGALLFISPTDSTAPADPSPLPGFTVIHDMGKWKGVTAIPADLRRHSGAWVWELSPGGGSHTEVMRLWPSADPDIEMLWLAEVKGGLTIELFDVLTLEGDLSQYGLHPDCRTSGDSGAHAAVLLSFAGSEPVRLKAWGVDPSTKSFVEVDDLTNIALGPCVTPSSRR